MAVDQELGTGAGHDTHAYATYEYDDAGHLVEETLPEVADPANPGSEISPVIQHVYDWLDNEVRTIDERGKEWDFLYDAYRRLIQTESPSGVIAQNEFRLRAGASYKHEMTTWTPPGTSSGVPTVTSYDVLGRTQKPRDASMNLHPGIVRWNGAGPAGSSGNHADLEALLTEGFYFLVNVYPQDNTIHDRLGTTEQPAIGSTSRTPP